MKSLRTFCVSHKAPLLPAQSVDFIIGLGDYAPECGAHISSLSEFWDGMREVAYGAAGNYAIPHAIERLTPTTELTGVFSHRKFIMRSRVGREAARYPVFREIPLAEASGVLRDELLPLSEREFLIGAPLSFPQGLIGQFIDKHKAIDLYEYLTIAREVGILSDDEVQSFSKEKVFFPGGCELGVYPTVWLYETLRKLELVGRVFLSRAAARIRAYDSYQVRAVGFLAERLGSFLLLKELRARYPKGVPREVLGHLYVVIEEGQVYSPATAAA